MKNKAVLGMMLTGLLVISMLTLAFNIQPVRAEPRAWTVDDDGPADFSKIKDAIMSPEVADGDTILVRSGTYHEHDINVYKSLSLIGEDKSTTVIDGDGFGPVVRIHRLPPKPVNITGFTIRNGSQDWFYRVGSGILLYYAESCNISDLIVSNCRYGITSYSGGHNIIDGNTISYTTQGIPLYYSEKNTIAGNAISNGVQVGTEPPYGVQVYRSINNTVMGNTVTNISYTGIRLTYATRNIVSGNIVTNTSVGIAAEYTSTSNTIVGNKASNNDIGIEVYGQSNNNVLTWNNVSDNSFGIRLGSSLSTIVSQNNVTSNDYGIDISDSSNGNRIAGNNLTSNVYGIMLSDSSRNSVLGNDMINNHAGIYLGQSSNNSITENKITNNGYGIMFAESSNNSIAGNNIIANNYDGIWLVFSSNNNSIAGNNIVANNRHGIWLWDSSNNRIFHNNFINNALQAFSKLVNVWHDGYPSGGNYWSDYADVDLYSGPNQNVPGMDRIWDHLYVIDSENQDRYPLVKPWPTIPATLDVDPDTLNLKSKGLWITTYIELPIGYDVNNIDIPTIMLDDTFLVDPDAPTQIGDHDMDGTPDLMVKFNRTQLQSHIYHVLGIRYGPVTLEITGQLYDGTPFEGSDTISVNYAGDANNDGTINILDVGAISAHWYPGPPIGPLGYDSHADLNNDGTVNVLDAGILSVNWGKTVPPSP